MLGAVSLLVADHRVDGFDRQAFAVLALAPGSPGARVAKPAAEIGPPLVGLAVLVSLVLLARRRAWLEAVVIVTGFVLTRVGASIARGLEGRRRPPGPLLDAGGFSFPSSVSALCVGLVAIAVALASLTSDRTRRNFAIAAGCLLTVAAGLLMVALRVHYFTDVVAGCTLGVVAFASCALAALATRRNARPMCRPMLRYRRVRSSASRSA